MKKERRKKRIIEIENERIVTLTTYKRFRKRLITEGVEYYSYKRKTKTYIYSEYEIIRKIRKEKQKELIESKIRIRRTVVLNLRSYEEPYAVSIKATTINPEEVEDALKQIVLEVFRDSQYYHIDWYKKQIGYEPSTELGTYEDLRLNDGSVWITIQERTSTPLNLKYK